MNNFARTTALATLAISVLPTNACLNGFRLEKGEPVTLHTKSLPKAKVDPLAASLLRDVETPPKADWAEREKSLRPRAIRSDASYQLRSDYAVTLLHLGRTSDALNILEPLAKAHPNDYRIIANLGTAYELDGQLDRALTNISKAIKLNPASHQGTEWLHVKILEAKIATGKDPNWLKTHSVLGYEITGVNPMTIPESLAKDFKQIDNVKKAVAYQLHERLQFVRPPDPTVADLLFDTGNLYAAFGNVETAAPLYKASLKFSNLRQAAIQQRLNTPPPVFDAPLESLSKKKG